MNEAQLMPILITAPSPLGEGRGEGMPFILKVNHPVRPVKVMALIECNRNISKMLRKEKDQVKCQQLAQIMKVNSKIILSL